MNATATAVQKEAEAKSAETKAKTAEGDAIEQRRIAEINLAEAKRQEGIATENAKEASRQELIAKANQDEAEKQRKIADDLRKRATNVANEAEKQSLKLIKDVKIQPYIYYFVEALPDLSDGGVPSDLLEKAWAKWQNVAGIRVGLVHTAKDANVIVKTSPEGLSGPPMLAHVGPPRDGVQLELTFNAQVSWDTDKFESHVCHEIGHILGLTHTTTPGQLMYPIAHAGIKSPQSEDIQRIRAIWGDLPPPISIK